MGLALNAAGNAKAAVPLGSLANQIYQIMCAQVPANINSCAYKRFDSFVIVVDKDDDVDVVVSPLLVRATPPRTSLRRMTS